MVISCIFVDKGEVRGTNMCEKNSNNGDENNQNFYLSVGIGIGLTIGAAIGVIFNNIAIGAGIGMLLGIAIGALIDKNTKDVKRSVIKIVVLSILGAIIVLLIPKILDFFW
jgi:F0F1-type ATP synthase assembly protein I